MGELNIGITVGASDSDPTSIGSALAAEASRQLARYRTDYPERELWNVVRNNGDNTFDLEKPGRGQMLAVPAIHPDAKYTIRPGATVVVGYLEVNRQRPYIKGLANNRLRRACEVTGLHVGPLADQSRTGQELEAGERPLGVRMDENWKTDAIGNARLEYPTSLVSGRLSGRPVGWAACAWGNTAGNYSLSQSKRVTCFDLVTGETLWAKNVFASTQNQQNFPALYLEPTGGELIVANQFILGVGSVTLERLSACTGKSIAVADPIQDDIRHSQSLTVIGDFLVGTVPAHGVLTAAKSGRLVVFKRGEKKGYVPVYQLEIPLDPGLGFSSLTGGGLAGYYYPETGQAILVVFDRTNAGSSLIYRSKVISWHLLSGKIDWVWNPYSLGINPSVNWLDIAAQRDPDGSIYLTILANHNSTSLSTSWLVKLSRTGDVLWSQSVAAGGTGGKKFNSHLGQGVFGENFLSHFQYNSGSVTQRPILVNRATGAVTEGLPNARLYSLEPCWGGEWLYSLVETLSGGTQLRYHLTDRGLESQVTYDQVNGLGRDARSTPDAGPAFLWSGYVYGVNWDSVNTCWRVRRWN